MKSNKLKQTCDWTPDDDGNWGTECGGLYIIIEGTPTENSMRFCCYCGCKLRERKPSAEAQ